MEEKKNNYLAIVAILSVIFGSVSGVLAEIITRNYLDNLYISYPTGELNLSNGFKKPRLEIKEAKNVVVEQDDKTDAVVNSARNSMVGIFKKSLPVKSAKNPEVFDLSRFYKEGSEVADGFIITSDGWIVTNFKIDDVAGYVVVTSDKNIFSIDSSLPDKVSGFYFLHVDAKDFPVLKFAERGNLRNGQVVVGVARNGEAILSSITNKDNIAAGTVRSSDYPSSKIMTLNGMDGSLAVFSLGGETVGLVDKSGKIEPINYFLPAFSSLLKSKTIKRPSLGVNYINLADMIPQEENDIYKAGAVVEKDDKGVAVAAGSPAAMMGIKEGDVILSVNSILIDDDYGLCDIIQKFSAGDTVTVEFQRGTEKKDIELKLGELK